MDYLHRIQDERRYAKAQPLRPVSNFELVSIATHRSLSLERPLWRESFNLLDLRRQISCVLITWKIIASLIPTSRSTPGRSFDAYHIMTGPERTRVRSLIVRGFHRSWFVSAPLIGPSWTQRASLAHLGALLSNFRPCPSILFSTISC